MRASALLAIFTCITANLVSLSLAGKHPGEWEWKDLTDDGYVFSCSSKDGDWDKMTPKTDMISPNYCYNHCTWYVKSSFLCICLLDPERNIVTRMERVPATTNIFSIWVVQVPLVVSRPRKMF